MNKMNKQLELFPDLEWEIYEYRGKTYRRKDYGVSYKKRKEFQINLQKFINKVSHDWGEDVW